MLCDNLERLDGVRGGREVQDGGNIGIPVAKVIILQLKLNKKKLPETKDPFLLPFSPFEDGNFYNYYIMYTLSLRFGNR